MANSVKGAKRLQDAMNQAIDQILSPENMRKIGKQAADMIKLRTRLGFGAVKDGAEKEKLKPLTKTTIEQRKGNIAFFKSPSTGKPIPYKPDSNGAKIQLSNQTSPSKSNLTRTGQLLDSEQVISASRANVAIGPKGGRNDGKTNEKVAQYVTDAGRPFNNLSKVEVKRLQDAIKKDLRDRIKRLLTT